MKQYIITMFVMTIVFLFLINGCGTTKTTVATSADLAALNIYSNINIDQKDGNFDLHIFTNKERALIVPCYYWTIVDSDKN